MISEVNMDIIHTLNMFFIFDFFSNNRATW
jgi:hypothetical protein